MEKKVACGKCGYLGLRNRRTKELVEVPGEVRSSGKNPAIDGLSERVYDDTPLCVVMAHDLADDIDERERGKDHPNLLQVFEVLRSCSESTKWRVGFGPKEHLEMNWLNEQREREEARIESAQRWRDEQARIAEDRHRETLRESNKLHWREMSIMGGLVTLLVCGTQVLCVWLSSGK